MTIQNICFSGMRFGIKGDNSPQIVKNMAWFVSHDIHQTNSTSIQTKMEDLLKTSMIGIGDGVGVFDWMTDTIDKPYIMCAMLENPVIFPAVDDCPLDILLILVSPEKNGPLHLQYLSRLTRVFRDPQLLRSLRSVTSVDGMMAVLSLENRRLMAA